MFGWGWVGVYKYYLVQILHLCRESRLTGIYCHESGFLFETKFKTQLKQILVPHIPYIQQSIKTTKKNGIYFRYKKCQRTYKLLKAAEKEI